VCAEAQTTHFYTIGYTYRKILQIFFYKVYRYFFLKMMKFVDDFLTFLRGNNTLMGLPVVKPGETFSVLEKTITKILFAQVFFRSSKPNHPKECIFFHTSTLLWHSLLKLPTSLSGFAPLKVSMVQQY